MLAFILLILRRWLFSDDGKESQTPMRVLFTNSLTFGAYATIQRLARSHNCFVMDSCAFKITSLDKRVQSLLNPYAPAYETHAYIEQLISYIKTYEIDLVVPLGEENKYITMFREKVLQAVQRPCRIFCAEDFASFDRLDDKQLFHRFIDELEFPSIRVPRIVDAQGLEDDRTYIVKPRLGKAGFKSYPIEKGAVLRCKTLAPDVFMQEFIEGGRELCVAGIASGGQTAFVVYRSEIGVNYRFSRERVVEKALESAIPTIIGRAGYEGYFGFDLIEKDGIFYFLECNARATLGAIAIDFDLGDAGESPRVKSNGYDQLAAPMLGVYSQSVPRALFSLLQGYRLFDLRYSLFFPIAFFLYHKFRGPGLSQVMGYGFLRSRDRYEYYAAGAEVYIRAHRALYRLMQRHEKDATSADLGSALEASGLSPEAAQHIQHILSEKQRGREWMLASRS